MNLYVGCRQQRSLQMKKAMAMQREEKDWINSGVRDNGLGQEPELVS